MSKQIPTAQQMEASRKVHHFNDVDSAVVTQLMPTGDYGAWLDDDPERGTCLDTTRLGAIAELYKAMREYE